MFLSIVISPGLVSVSSLSKITRSPVPGCALEKRDAREMASIACSHWYNNIKLASRLRPYGSFEFIKKLRKFNVQFIRNAKGSHQI